MHGLVEVVRDEDDRLAERALQLDELLLHLAADQRVQRRERLVHEQDVGVGGERAGQADALAHAARELRRQRVVPALEADEVERPGGTLATLRLVDALDLERVGRVLEDGPVGEQREVLEHHRHPGAAQLAKT
ncbi:hypothetical protein GCM10025864_28980 [Luteimicrobium album]|uniref:Uncharacterized protein n=1 Tax=Luteimicrobium album TaxID=1054550 RepID=A0ABQ6I5A5_9MICO|nr:hypothetical protein GCM10025864_28980 [Luteimicrobium album]